DIAAALGRAGGICLADVDFAAVREQADRLDRSATRSTRASPDPQLLLQFEATADSVSILTRRRVRYPFSVTAPIAGRDDALLVVQSSSGGLYGDEALRQRVGVGLSARVELRFPSAMVVNAARADTAAQQSIELDIAPGARLRYLQRPLILLPGAMIRQRIVARLETNASLTLREGFMLHHPAAARQCSGSGSGSAEASASASATSRPRSIDNFLRIEDAWGRPMVIDRFQADDAVLAAGIPGVTGRFKAFGALWHVGPEASDRVERLRAALRDAFADDRGTMVSASALVRGSGLVIRVASTDGGGLDDALQRCQMLLDAG
ncbi:MAG: ureD, partial [Rhizobacter sp.]|nr:ureD [Rhizobacter sp.]